MGLSTKQVSGGDHHHHHHQHQPGIIEWDNPQTPFQTGGSTRLDLLTGQPQSVQNPQKAEPLKCPRCASANTKFCYYNNYNKSQPRHFCKGCKRHWTEGGTLRNVPVGGSRKNKRLKTPNPNAVTAVIATSAPATGDDKKPVFSGEQKNNPPGSTFFPAVQPDPVIGNNAAAAAAFNVGPTPVVLHDDQDAAKLLPFSFSSCLGYFDPISCSIPCLNTQSSSNNAYRDIIGGELDNVEESTITTVMPFTSSAIISQPWQQDQGITDMANYWSLSDIDSLVSADLNIPWDDLEIKPKGK